MQTVTLRGLTSERVVRAKKWPAGWRAEWGFLKGVVANLRLVL